MKTINTNDNRTWVIVDSKTNPAGVVGHLCHSLMNDPTAPADWSLVAVKGDMTRCQVFGENESAARAKFATI